MKAKFCCNCKQWQWSELAQEQQCWCDNCIHEGEERDDFESACSKFEEEGEEHDDKLQESQ